MAHGRVSGPKLVNREHGSFEACLVATARVWPKSLAIEVVAECGVEREPIPIDADDTKTIREVALRIRASAQEMDAATKVFRRNACPSVSSRDAKSENEVFRNDLFERRAQRHDFGNNDNAARVLAQFLRLIEYSSQIRSTRDIKRDCHTGTDGANRIEMTSEIVTLPVDIDKPDA